MARDILHVLGSLGRGGIETWLVRLLQRSPELASRSRLCLTAVAPGSPGVYAEEVRALGIPIHHVRFSAPGFGFIRSLAGLMRQTTPRVVHSHLNTFSGYAILAAWRAGVPRRIAHYHAQKPAHRGWAKEGYATLARTFERRLATDIVAVSQAVLRSYDDMRQDATVVPLGIDTAPYLEAPSRDIARHELGLSMDSFVVGCVARLDGVKNQEFLLHVHLALLEQEPKAVLVLVGDGPMRQELQHRVDELGLGDSVRILGQRDDVASLLPAFDVFALPSLLEGFAMAVLEAQAAGLPCVVSTGVPGEAAVQTERVRRLPLAQPVTEWAEALLKMGSLPSLSAREACERIDRAGFTIERSIDSLLDLYR